MENPISELHIKQEEADGDEIYSTVLAAKIYCIEEQTDQDDPLYNSNPDFCESQYEGLNEYDNENEFDFYENIFLGKVEVQETNNIESEFIDAKFDEDSKEHNCNRTIQTESESVQEVDVQIHRKLLCPICGTEFETFVQWRRHLNDSHEFNKLETLNMECISSTEFRCKQCKAKLGSQMQNLQHHRILHLPYRRYIKCKLCDQDFKACKSHTRHLQVDHNINYSKKDAANNLILLCPICGAEFPKYSKWREHLNSIHEFNKFENLNMEHISDKKAKCKQCGTYLNTSKIHTLQTHNMIHLPYKRHFKCKLCGKIFLCIRSQQRHFDKAHKGKDKDYSKAITSQTNATLICPYCGVEFPNYFEWRTHLNSIHEFKRHENLNMEFVGAHTAKCKECHKKIKFRRTWNLQEHKIIHLPYRQFIKCKSCNSNFSSNSLFTRHFEESHKNESIRSEKNVSSGIENNSNNPILLCPFCGTEFLLSSLWRHHLNNIHEFTKRESLNIEDIGNNRAKCKQCNAKIITKLHCLQNHKITHLPYKRHFKCKLCEQLSTSVQNHKRHMRLTHNLP